MPVYQVTAKDRAGETRVTTVAAGTDRSAAAVLQERGMFVLDVKRLSPLRGRAPGDLLRDLVSPVKSDNLALFFRHYATLTHVGFSPPSALTKMSSRLTDVRLERFAADASARTRSGEPLSAAMRMRSLMFPEWVTGMVATAEQSGRFDDLLPFLHRELQDAGEFELSYRLPLVYLRVVVVLALVLTTAGALVANGVTGWLSAMICRFLPAVVLVQAAAWGVRGTMRLPNMRPTWDAILSALPGIGSLRRARALRCFARAVEALYHADRPVHDAYLNSMSVVDDPFVAGGLRRGAAAILDAQTVTQALAESRLIDTRILNELLRLETAGKMDEFVLLLVRDRDAALTAAVGRAKATLWGVLIVASVLLIFAGATVGLASVMHGAVSKSIEMIQEP